MIYPKDMHLPCCKPLRSLNLTLQSRYLMHANSKPFTAYVGSISLTHALRRVSK